MANFTYTVGSKTSTYYEFFEGTRVLSPRTELLRPPYAYTSFNPYDWVREAYKGPMVTYSKYPNLAPPHYTSSSWSFCSISNITAKMPSTASTLSKLVDKWKNSDVNLGVSLGESKESISMIYSSLASIYRSARAIKRGNLGEALRQFKEPLPRRVRRKAARQIEQGDLSSAWLSLHLGWVPLVGDIYAAADYVADDGAYAKISSGWDRGEMSAITRGGRIVEQRCARRYVAVIETPPLEIDRLGLANPAVIAWELVPLSFVADYFLPIGDWLNALSSLRMDAPRFMVQERYELRVQHPPVLKGQKIGTGSYSLNSYPGQTYVWKRYIRRNTTPAAQLVSASLTIDVPTSAKRLANMAALTHQSILNLRKR